VTDEGTLTIEAGVKEETLFIHGEGGVRTRIYGGRLYIAGESSGTSPEIRGILVANYPNAEVGQLVNFNASRGLMVLASNDDEARPATHVVAERLGNLARLVSYGEILFVRYADGAGTSGSPYVYLGENGFGTDDMGDLRDSSGRRSGNVEFIQKVAVKVADGGSSGGLCLVDVDNVEP
jgi:hypothetical protein